MQNIPLTKVEVEELPKGYHSAKTINRRFRKGLTSKKMQVIMSPDGKMEIIPNNHPNCRKLTHKNNHRKSGSYKFKMKKYGRVA